LGFINTDVLGHDGTVVVRGADDVTVTLTATITLVVVDGVDLVDTKDFTVVVKNELYALTGMTVAEALLETDGSIIVVQGIVAAYPSFAKGYFIQDADGTAMVYWKWSNI
jgi:hypothetical protein